jgi:hypothetical protein
MDLIKHIWYLIHVERQKEAISAQMSQLKDLEDFENETRYAAYQSFSIGDANSKYRLQVTGYYGDAGI